MKWKNLLIDCHRRRRRRPFFKEIDKRGALFPKAK